MKSIQRLPHPIITFLEDHMGIYLNKNKVQFCLFLDSSDSICGISISCNYPGNNFTEFRIFKVFDDINELLRQYPFISVRGLDKINPNDCLKLYQEGKMSTSCITDSHTGTELIFTIDKQGLHAKDETLGLDEIVISELKTPEDYF